MRKNSSDIPPWFYRLNGEDCIRQSCKGNRGAAVFSPQSTTVQKLSSYTHVNWSSPKFFCWPCASSGIA